MSRQRDDAADEARAGAEALERLGIQATCGIEYVYAPNGENYWRSRVSINGRTAGQLALEVRAARQS